MGNSSCSGTVRTESSDTNSFFVSFSQNSNRPVSINSLDLLRSFRNLISDLLLLSSFIGRENNQNLVADIIVMADMVAIFFSVIGYSLGPSLGYDAIPIALHFQRENNVATDS